MIHFLFSNICLASTDLLFAAFFLIVAFQAHGFVLRKALDMTSIFLNFPRLILWPSMQSILENVSYALVKNVYFAAFRGNVIYIYIYIWFIWFNESFKASVFLLIFCLDDMSIDVSGVGC